MHKDLLGITFQYHFAKTGIPYSIWSVVTLLMFLSSVVLKLIRKLPLGQRLIGALVFLFVVYCAVNDFLTAHRIVDWVMMAEYGFPICIAFVFGYFLLEEGRTQDKILEFNKEILTQKELAEKRLEITQAFTRKSIVEKIRWNQDPRDIRPETKNAAVLFADIRNFTSYVEYRDPIQVVNFLNDYFNQMNKVVTKHNGETDKLIGDGLMAIFFNADDAVNAAIEMRATLPLINLPGDQVLNI